MGFVFDIEQNEWIRVDDMQKVKKDARDVRFLLIGRDCGVHVVVID